MRSVTEDRTTTDRWCARRDVALVAILSLATIVVLAKDITVGGLRHGDSAAHAMDGVLIRDWLAAGPGAWSRPMQFACEQYAHYPTLGIGRHYPPGFALAEVPFFALMGVSATSARACVVFFGLLATVGTYFYLRSFANRLTASLAAVAFIALPATTQWGRQVMLEVPTMAIMIWVAVALAHYLNRPSYRRLMCVLSIALLAMFFKQPAVFLLATLSITFVIFSFAGKMRPSHGILTSIVCLIALVVVVMSLDGHGSLLLRGDASFESRWSWEALTFYLQRIPKQVGLAILCAAVAGIFFVRRLPGIHVCFLACWIITCYVMLVVADYKNARFLYLALFPLAVIAAISTAGLLDFVKSLTLRHGVGILASAACLGSAYGRPVEYRPDYGPVVIDHQERIRSRAILFSGLREGDFVFAVRQHLPWRSTLVIRASKLLYTCNGRTDLNFESSLGSAEELESLVHRFGFQSIFLEEQDKLGLKEERWLRDFVGNSADYEKTGMWHFNVDEHPSYRDSTVVAFQSVRPLTRVVKHFDIWIPRSRRTIRVDLRQWS